MPRESNWNRLSILGRFIPNIEGKYTKSAQAVAPMARKKYWICFFIWLLTLLY
jgi:hypothetical protein